MSLLKKFLKIITFLLGCGLIGLFIYIGVEGYLSQFTDSGDGPWVFFLIPMIWLPILGFLFIAVSRKIKN